MDQGRNPMRKGSWTGHMHSHLSEQMRRRRWWALDSDGDSARRALWMRDGGGWGWRERENEAK